jgi:hypothetical protein
MCHRSMYRITLRYYRATYKYSHFRIAALLYFSAVKGGGGLMAVRNNKAPRKHLVFPIR